MLEDGSEAVACATLCDADQNSACSEPQLAVVTVRASGATGLPPPDNGLSSPPLTEPERRHLTDKENYWPVAWLRTAGFRFRSKLAGSLGVSTFDIAASTDVDDNDWLRFNVTLGLCVSLAYCQKFSDAGPWYCAALTVQSLLVIFQVPPGQITSTLSKCASQRIFGSRCENRHKCPRPIEL